MTLFGPQLVRNYVRGTPYVLNGIAIPIIVSYDPPQELLFVSMESHELHEIVLSKNKTPIEKMFREIVGREMTRNERRALLPSRRKTNKKKLRRSQ